MFQRGTFGPGHALAVLTLGAPVLSSIESPVLMACYAAFLALYLLCVSMQIRRISRSSTQASLPVHSTGVTHGQNERQA
jgi:hypothetical protein